MAGGALMQGGFEYYLADTLEHALAALSENPDWEPVAGCTNTLVDARSGRHRPQGVVDISKLRELRQFRREDGMIRVGALTTLADCANDPFFEAEAPLLRMMAMEFAGPLIRNRATLGGNLAYGSPAADSAPALQAMGAEVILASRERGERTVDLAEFFKGPRSTALEQDELITEIRFPAQMEETRIGYRKFALRKAMAVSVVSVAAVLQLGGNRVEKAGLALGAVAPIPYRVKEVENLLRDQVPDAGLIGEASKKASASANPISDIRASAEYRVAMVGVMTRRVLSEALGVAEWA
jgi:CO/xanthine dehydrogenase FAD-binding subunit